jgi:hypothetical protein
MSLRSEADKGSVLRRQVARPTPDWADMCPRRVARATGARCPVFRWGWARSLAAAVSKTSPQRRRSRGLTEMAGVIGVIGPVSIAGPEQGLDGFKVWSLLVECESPELGDGGGYEVELHGQRVADFGC